MSFIDKVRSERSKTPREPKVWALGVEVVAYEILLRCVGWTIRERLPFSPDIITTAIQTATDFYKQLEELDGV